MNVFLLCFLLFFCLLILSDVDWMHFVFFYYMWNVFNLKLISASSRAGWAVNPYGLSPTLCDLNMLDHSTFSNLKSLMLLYFHQHAVNFCPVISLFFLLLTCIVSWFVLQKYMNVSKRDRHSQGSRFKPGVSKLFCQRDTVQKLSRSCVEV